jgi:hypothetical protein
VDGKLLEQVPYSLGLRTMASCVQFAHVVCCCNSKCEQCAPLTAILQNCYCFAATSMSFRIKFEFSCLELVIFLDSTVFWECRCFVTSCFSSGPSEAPLQSRWLHFQLLDVFGSLPWGVLSVIKSAVAGHCFSRFLKKSTYCYQTKLGRVGCFASACLKCLWAAVCAVDVQRQFYYLHLTALPAFSNFVGRVAKSVFHRLAKNN